MRPQRRKFWPLLLCAQNGHLHSNPSLRAESSVSAWLRVSLLCESTRATRKLYVSFPRLECQRSNARATYGPSELPYRFDRTETTCFSLVSDSASRLPAYPSLVAH